MKSVLITGSTKGLGFHIAKLMADLGYKIILTGRTIETLENARKKLVDPEKHIIFCGDLLDKKSIQALCDLPFVPDVIVHNLGGKVSGDGQPLQSDILTQSIALNLSVAVDLNLHYLPLMQKVDTGRIIHVSSEASETGFSAPGLAAAKAAVNAYVKSSARYYAKNNIMICAVLPSVFLHPDSVWDQKRKSDPNYYERRLKEQPLGRFLSVEEISELVVSVADSKSMAYSGSLIRLTGGY